MDDRDESRRSRFGRRSRAASSSPLRRAVARWGLAAVVVGSALAMGTVHTSVLIAVTLAALLVFGLHFWDARPLEVRREATLLLVLGVALTTWTFLQQVPLPASVVAVVAPGSADIWARSLMPLREAGPASISLSLDPTATRVQVLRGVLYVLVFACALRSASRTDGVKFLGRTIVASATLLGVSAIAHRALGMRKVFGIVEPTSIDFGTRIAPLLNPNHLSAYVNLGGCIALAGALSRASRMPRVALLGVYLLLVGIQLWLASRAGVASMVLGSLLVLWFARRSDRNRKGLPFAYVALGALLLASVGVVVLGSGGQSVVELMSRDTIKIGIIRRSWELLGVFPLAGVGRGAFESVFPAFRADGEGHLVVTHPENIVMQWGVEWGIPIGIGALAVAAWALRPAAAMTRSSVPVGPAAALIAVVAHNLLDFSIEIPAVALALAVCAACVVGGAGETSAPAAAPWWTRRPRALVGVTSATAGLAVILAGTTFGRDLHSDEARLRRLAADDSIDRTAFALAAREAMLRHPAAPYLPFMGAVRAARTREESAIPWIARTLERAAVYGRAHLLLARQLGRRHPAQARLEYRLAMEQDPNLAGHAIAEGAELVLEADDALELVPVGRSTEDVMIDLAALLRPRVPAAAARLDQELELLFPTSRRVALGAAERAVQDLAERRPPCDVDAPVCVRRARERIVHLTELTPRACAPHRLAAQVSLLAGEGPQALAELERTAETLDDPLPCLRYVLEALKPTKDDARIEAVVLRLLNLSCGPPDECATAHLQAIATEQQLGRSHGAVRFAKRGHDRLPDRIDLLRALAETSAAAALHAQALSAYKKLAAREPDNAAWRDAIARERDALGRMQQELPVP